MRTLLEAGILFAAAFALLIYAHLTGVFDYTKCSHETNQTQINLTTKEKGK